MGILRKGILDGFDGKVGPLCGRRLKGINVISSARHESLKPLTAAQIIHRANFALVMGFLKLFKELIAQGFKDIKGKKYSFNRAFSYNFKRVLAGQAPDYYIDCTKLIYSRGPLLGPNSPRVCLGNHEILVTWLPDLQSRFNQYTDKASFAIYCPDKKFSSIYKDEVIRADLGCSLPLQSDWQGCPVHVYMSFSSADGKQIGDSFYLGTV